MQISEVIEHASSGVLNQLAIKDKPDSIIGFINLGLIDLHKKFLLKVEEFLIDVEPRRTMYSMPDDYMFTISASSFGKTNDSAPPLDFEVVEIPVNKESDPTSIYTPYFNKIQVPSVHAGNTISVLYAASPETVADPDDELELPSYLLECLLLYIGYQAYAAMDVKALAAENTFYNRYLQACEQVKQLGLIGSDAYITPGVQAKGFV